MELPHSLPAAETLEQEFFVSRCKIIEIAAILDRLDRGEGDVKTDPRVAQLQAAIKELLSSDANRAERIQLIFSDEYDESWFEKFEPAR